MLCAHRWAGQTQPFSFDDAFRKAKYEKLRRRKKKRRKQGAKPRVRQLIQYGGRIAHDSNRKPKGWQRIG